MERDMVPDLQEKNGDSMKKAIPEAEDKKEGMKGAESAAESSGSSHTKTAAEVNMEASITSDDMMRAGGFGARDDIGSVLPVAMDSTDFEATLRDARDYEEPQGQITRPGVGWTEAKKP